jgi:hypothetical protein
MNITSILLHGYMAPALTGVYVAAAASAESVAAVSLLLAFAVVSAFASLPAGRRLLSRIGEHKG